MNISNYLRDKLLNQVIGAVNFTPAATLKIKLFSTTLTAAGAGTEISNAGYAPKSLTNNLTNFPATTTGTKTNNVRFDFDAATEDWDDILSVGIFDAADNLYFFKNLDAPYAISDGQNIYLDANDLEFVLS